MLFFSANDVIPLPEVFPFVLVFASFKIAQDTGKDNAFRTAHIKVHRISFISFKLHYIVNGYFILPGIPAESFYVISQAAVYDGRCPIGFGIRGNSKPFHGNRILYPFLHCLYRHRMHIEFPASFVVTEVKDHPPLAIGIIACPEPGFDHFNAFPDFLFEFFQILLVVFAADITFHVHGPAGGHLHFHIILAVLAEP